MKRSQFHSTMPSSSSSSTVSDQLIRTPWKSGFLFLIEKDRELCDWSIKISGIQKTKNFQTPIRILQSQVRSFERWHLLYVLYAVHSIDTSFTFFSLSSWLQNERHLFKSNCSNHICSIDVYLNQIVRIVFVRLKFV